MSNNYFCPTPKSKNTPTYGNLSSLDTPPSLINGAECNFPNNYQNMHMLKLDDTWTQTLPNNIEHKTNNIETGGWAINPNFHFKCQNNGYCPYACEPGYIEVQYDNSIGQPWWWEAPVNVTPIGPTGPCDFRSTLEYIGAGRRSVPVNTNDYECAGGRQGAHCSNGSILLDSPSNQVVPEYNQKYCVLTPQTIKIKNNTPYKIVLCRTVFPGSEDPQIPTTFEPYSSHYITTVPSCNVSEWASKYPSCSGATGSVPMWWTAGENSVSGIEYFVSRADEQALTLVCQWNSIRPSRYLSSDSKTIGGVDYYPYIIEISSPTNVSINTNNDYTAGDTYTTYDRSLGNPGFGMRLYTPDYLMVGSVEYRGPLGGCPKADPYGIICSTGCTGNCDGCADSIVYPIILDNRGNNLSDPTNLAQGISYPNNQFPLPLNGVTSAKPITIEFFVPPDIPIGLTNCGVQSNVTLRQGTEITNNIIPTLEVTPFTPVTTAAMKNETTTKSESSLTWLWILLGILALIIIIGIILYFLLRPKPKPAPTEPMVTPLPPYTSPKETVPVSPAKTTLTINTATGEKQITENLAPGETSQQALQLTQESVKPISVTGGVPVVTAANVGKLPQFL